MIQFSFPGGASRWSQPWLISMRKLCRDIVSSRSLNVLVSPLPPFIGVQITLGDHVDKSDIPPPPLKSLLCSLPTRLNSYAYLEVRKAT